MTSNEAFTINLEWKGVPMDSTFGNLRLDSIMIKMTFLRNAKEWRLATLEASKTAVAGANLLDSQTQVRRVQTSVIMPNQRYLSKWS